MSITFTDHDNIGIIKVPISHSLPNHLDFCCHVSQWCDKKGYNIIILDNAFAVMSTKYQPSSSSDWYNILFCKIVGKVQPGYTPPARTEIADKYLPMIYDQEYGKCAKELMHETMSHQMDGLTIVMSQSYVLPSQLEMAMYI